MHCDEALNEINRMIDRDGPSGDRAALMEHLAQCEPCRAMYDELRGTDAALLRAFMPRRRAAAIVADRVIEQLQSDRRRQQRLWSWAVPLAAAAAGFLLAIVVLQPRKPQSTPAAAPLARLALATGPTQVRPASTIPWFGCPTNGQIERGSCVRTTDAARCEIEANDGTQIRLDAGTTIELPTPRCVRLTQGELYSAVSGDGGDFKIELPDAVVNATRGKFDVSCSPGEASLTVVEGSATMSCQSGTCRVAAGERVRVVGGHAEKPSTVVDPLQATAWVNELLLLKGPENAELTERLSDILAQIGHAKVSYLYEDEIRRLGSRAVLPLLRFVASPRSRADDVSRIAAARIAADLADDSVIGELVQLVVDRDALVRFHATRALVRLAGANYGFTSDAAEQDSDSLEATREAWDEWRESRSAPHAATVEQNDR